MQKMSSLTFLAGRPAVLGMGRNNDSEPLSVLVFNFDVGNHSDFFSSIP